MRANPFLSKPSIADTREQIKKLQGEYSDKAYKVVTNQGINNTVSISNEILFTLLFGQDTVINIRI